jgi:hypothetical protein
MDDGLEANALGLGEQQDLVLRRFLGSREDSGRADGQHETRR